MLARLARGPHSGYELVQALKKPIGFFWAARQSQIYPELAHLEALGLVTYILVEQTTRPDKKVYSLTNAGREALQTWAVAPVEPEPSRDEFLLKTYTMWLADPVQALTLLREREKAHRARLAEYERILASQRAFHPAPLQVHEPLFGDHATLQMGLRYEQACLDWYRWMIEQFEQAVSET